MSDPVVHEALYLEVIRYAFWIIGVVTTLGIGETLRRLIRMEKKQDEARETHNQCRLSLLSKKEFQDWKEGDFTKWQSGRDGPDGLWHALNNHSHVGIEGDGKVIKT
jgi:hypothetical protein